MSRIKTKNLRTQFTVRVYDEDQYNVIKKALEKFKGEFDSINDAFRYFTVIGAEKMLGDNSINNCTNLAEINKNLEKANENISLLLNRQRAYFAETNGEVLTAQALNNFTNNMLCKLLNKDFADYSTQWKYTPKNVYEVEQIRNEFKRDLFDGNTQR